MKRKITVCLTMALLLLCLLLPSEALAAKVKPTKGSTYTGFEEINGKTYYFKKGKAVTGTKKISGVTYTFAKNGVLKKYSFPDLTSSDGNYSKTTSELVRGEIKKMIKILEKDGKYNYFTLSNYEKAVCTFQYVGGYYTYKSGGTTAEKFIKNGGGTCFGFSDLTYTMMRMQGIKTCWLCKPGRPVDHDGKMYGSRHRTVIARFGKKYYDFDANAVFIGWIAYQFSGDTGFLDPEQISASYAKYLLGKSKSYKSIH